MILADIIVFSIVNQAQYEIRRSWRGPACQDE